jgi:hypothetical protein
MNLVQVIPHEIAFICYDKLTGQRLRCSIHGAPIYADLDGEAFVDYYSESSKQLIESQEDSNEQLS